MKTEYKWISFEDESHLYPRKKTQTWLCRSRNGVELGEVKWWSQWRQYCYYPNNSAVYNVECLNDIASFVTQLMEERKK